MFRRAIVNLNKRSSTLHRVFDVVIEDPDKVFIEVKLGKDRFERIPWNDVIHQVNAAKNAQ